MATTAFKGAPVHTTGELPSVGENAAPFSLVGADLGEVSLAGLKGRQVVLNIFPSIDTGTCATSVRKFNQLAADLPDTTVVCVSEDLPFAASRFCSAEGIDNVVTGSAFRSDFGDVYGVKMTDGPLEGLLARSVVVINPDGQVTYTQLVPEITNEPDYDAVLESLDSN